MKARIILLLATALPGLFTSSSKAQGKYKMQPVTIQTRWAKEVSPSNALKEYPRPQMIRERWTNLNGLWDYAITPKDNNTPSKYDGQILVPYPLESALSGVEKSLLPNQNLWYKRSFIKPEMKSGERVKLNFGAVDYEATVYINGKEVGKHTGGYTEFSFDITSRLKPGNNELVVKVFDPSDQGVGPHGKQLLNPGNIYYAPSSGIWQTVWMEVVPETHIEGLVMIPDVDKGVLNLEVKGKGKPKVVLPGCSECGILKQVQDDYRTIITLRIPNAKLWSPASPFLYDLKVTMGKDEVKSYFGMRKVSIAKDKEGVDRIFLNNKPYFNLGTLDQGFWPDGLYTAPTDEALAFDIKAIKAMGFNTIRKHIKIEPARWYYWADKLGMLVWQDMVNPNQRLPEGSKVAFEKQSEETIRQLHSHPSITTWVLFNEKWGQYDQARLTKWLKDADPSRLVNGHSGELLYVDEKLRNPAPGTYVNSNMTDVHSYPDPMMSIKQDGKAQVLGEFGGIGVFVDDHQWNPEIAWGYVQEKPAGLKDKYAAMYEKLIHLKKIGLSASIYTQPFDVESEQNGLMTYDREVIKIPFTALREIHRPFNAELGGIPDVSAKNADLTDPEVVYEKMLSDYHSGKKDGKTIRKLLLMSDSFRDTTNLKFIIRDFIRQLKPPYSKSDLSLVMKFTKNTTDPGFSIVVDNKEILNNYLGTNIADGKIISWIDKELYNSIDPKAGSDQEPWSYIATNIKRAINWEKIREEAAKKYGNLGEEASYKAEGAFIFYGSGGDFNKILPLYTRMMDFLDTIYKDKAEMRVGGYALNNVAWAAFELVSDPELLKKALRWSKYSVEESPDNYRAIDTYANLLYKLGNKDEAIQWEKKAIELVPESESQVYKQILEKMEKGLKTW